MDIYDLSDSATKRTRASGEILNYLVHEFAKNANPSTALRREISNKTGMPERSVRIWFQNRRAKARKLEKLNQNHPNLISDTNLQQNNHNLNNQSPLQQQQQQQQHFSSSSMQLQNSLSPSPRLSLNNLETINEINGKYYVIECKTLSVGNWQRIKSGYLKSHSLPQLTNLSPKLLNEVMDTTDLLVVLSKKDKELNYFFSGVFQNEKVLFRIFYPIFNIIKSSILNKTQNPNSPSDSSSDDTLLQLELTTSPQFAVHFARDPSSGNENLNQWSICEDFSEGQQVANAFHGKGGNNIPHILSDNINNLKILSTLINSLNESHKATSSTFPDPISSTDSHIINTSITPNLTPITNFQLLDQISNTSLIPTPSYSNQLNNNNNNTNNGISNGINNNHNNNNSNNNNNYHHHQIQHNQLLQSNGTPNSSTTIQPSHSSQLQYLKYNSADSTPIDFDSAGVLNNDDEDDNNSNDDDEDNDDDDDTDNHNDKKMSNLIDLDMALELDDNSNSNNNMNTNLDIFKSKDPKDNKIDINGNNVNGNNENNDDDDDDDKDNNNNIIDNYKDINNDLIGMHILNSNMNMNMNMNMDMNMDNMNMDNMNMNMDMNMDNMNMNIEDMNDMEINLHHKKEIDLNSIHDIHNNLIGELNGNSLMDESFFINDDEINFM